MSQETIDLLNIQKKAQIEESPFSETFQIVGGDSFKGIFDEAFDMGPKDGGHVTQRSTAPAIMVSDIPVGLTKNTGIKRESGELFTWRRTGTDKEGIPVIWLF